MSKKLEIWGKKVKQKKMPNVNQMECHESEPNLSNDTAVPKGDNLSF
jgi:hypothetical protein